jgi:hypothetical protein
VLRHILAPVLFASIVISHPGTMHVMVHVRTKTIAISCGDGNQPVRWLANAGVTRYDDAQGRSLGTPVAVRLEDGTLLGLGQSISEAGIQDLQHVHVVFKGQKREGKGKHASLDEEDDA